MLAYDLTALERILRATKSYRPVCGQIRKQLAMRSVRRDLGMARAALSALGDLDAEHKGEPANSQLGLHGRALFTHALLLYVGGLKTSSEHRATIDMRATFSPQQARDHQRLCDLRDDAIAHYGPGGTIAEPWFDDRLVLLVAEPAPRLQSPWRVTNYRGAVVTALSGLIDHAEAEVGRRVQTHANQLLSELERLQADDAHFRDLMQAAPFDPQAFFGAGSPLTAEFGKPNAPNRTTHSEIAKPFEDR